MTDHDATRRRFVRDSGLILGAAAGGLLKVGRASSQATNVLADPHPAADRLLTRIAFGSCAKQDADQPIWKSVLDVKPDLFIFLGDNVYGDTRDMNVLRHKYAQLEAKSGFQRLRATTPILAVWDD